MQTLNMYPRGAMDLSAVCDCGISSSHSLSVLAGQAKLYFENSKDKIFNLDIFMQLYMLL